MTEKKREQRDDDLQGKTPSTADNNSFETGAGVRGTGYDSPPIASSQLSNDEVDQHDEYPGGDGQAGPRKNSNHP